MDTIVQLIRNALCCVKDMEYFSDTILYESKHVQSIWKTHLGQYQQLEDPYDRTTPLEVLIGITQFYACLSCMYGGFQLTWSSVGKLKRIVQLLENQLVLVNTNKTENKKNDEKKDHDQERHFDVTANRLINESLIREAKKSMKNIFIGLCVFPIGVAFFWLFGNSFHFTESGIIGGLSCLIDALTVMEFCLIPLLWYMIVDARTAFDLQHESTKVRAVLEHVVENTNQKEVFTHSYVNITRYGLMDSSGWKPYWQSGISPLSSIADDKENSIEKETKKIQDTLRVWFPTASSSSKEDDDDHDNDDDSNEKEHKIRNEALVTSMKQMEQSVLTLGLEGYREYLYFVLNFIAFYGYLMAIICFYYPDDTAQPKWVSHMKFGSKNNDADWTGNFSGDLMWTIEPSIILISPYYIAAAAASVPATAAVTTKATAKTKSD